MRNAHLTSTPIRARLVHLFAKAMGIVVHIEGFPFGSTRARVVGTGAVESSAS